MQFAVCSLLSAPDWGSLICDKFHTFQVFNQFLQVSNML